MGLSSTEATISVDLRQARQTIVSCTSECGVPLFIFIEAGQLRADFGQLRARGGREHVISL